MAVVGALQGQALWVLTDNWPSEPEKAAWFFAMAAFVTTSSVVAHMARCRPKSRRLVLLSWATGALFAALAWRIASLQPPTGAAFAGDDVLITSGFFVGIVVLYVLGPFLQLYDATGTLRFPYVGDARLNWAERSR
jgi:hypothetical protein